MKKDAFIYINLHDECIKKNRVVYYVAAEFAHRAALFPLIPTASSTHTTLGIINIHTGI